MAQRNPSVVAHTCNPRVLEAGADGAEIQSYPQLHSELSLLTSPENPAAKGEVQLFFLTNFYLFLIKYMFCAGD